MAKERALMTRNTGTAKKPVWEPYYPKTVADAVLMSDADGESKTLKTELETLKKQKGAKNGVAELDATGKVPAAQLPSYVDDVIEGYVSGGKLYKEAAHTTEITCEAGKIYMDLATNKTYRWSGTALVEISASLALGETEATAYRGDHGKVAYDHSQTAHAPSNAQKNVQSDWNESNTASDAFIKNKPTSLPAKGGNADTVNNHTVKTDVPENAVFTDTKPVAMKGATASAAGAAGYVPAPGTGKQNQFLRGDGTWAKPEDTTYADASQSVHGLMSAADKKKLDNVEDGAQKNVQSDWNETSVDAAGYIKNKPARLPANGGNADTVGGHTVAADVPENAKFTDTTYNDATQSAHGLMSAADKKKLDGLGDTIPTIGFGTEYPATAAPNSLFFLIS